MGGVAVYFNSSSREDFQCREGTTWFPIGVFGPFSLILDGSNLEEKKMREKEEKECWVRVERVF